MWSGFTAFKRQSRESNVFQIEKNEKGVISRAAGEFYAMCLDGRAGYLARTRAIFAGGRRKERFIYFKPLSCTEKLAHPPSEKAACDEETSGQEYKAQHPHSACDIGPVCNPSEKGIYGLGYGIVLLFQGEN